MEKIDFDNLAENLKNDFEVFKYDFFKLKEIFSTYDYRKEDIKISGKLFAPAKHDWNSYSQKFTLTIFAKTINLIAGIFSKLQDVLQELVFFVNYRTHPLYTKHVVNETKLGYLNGILDSLAIEKLNSVRYSIDVESYIILETILKDLIKEILSAFNDVIEKFTLSVTENKIQDI